MSSLHTDINDIKAKDQSTPLHVSAENGHLNIVQWLVENGANINEKSKEYLCYTTFFLMNKNTHTLDESKRTPMHSAAKYGRLETLKFLVSKGQDVNERGKTMYSWNVIF